ncbi:MAG TPA: hypothetical protein VKU87_07720, partial [Thermomicrobiaceae bacterium]|nr:hypothetical protein [Thermomicrobiaceae bacterium]
MPTDVVSLLRGYSREALLAMARWRGLDMMGKKEELVARLAPGFFDRAEIERTLAHLSGPERDLLDLVILAGGSASTAAVRGQLQAQGVTEQAKGHTGFSYQQPTGSPTAHGSRKFEDLVARLGAMGLLFTAIPVNSGSVVNFKTPGRRLYIPEEVLAIVPAVKIETELAPEPPVIRAADPTLILRDLYLLISFAEGAPIALTTRGLIPKRTLVAIDAGLRVSEEAAEARSEEELGRLPFLRALAEQLGLLDERLGKLHLGDRAADELSRPPGERQQALLAAYESTARWSELSRIPGLSIQGRGVSVHSAPELVVAARRRVLREVRELPAERWIPIDHLIERFRKGAYEFLFPRDWNPNNYYYYGYSQPPSPYQGNNALGWTFGSLDERRGWSTVEGGMIRVIVEEALHWLGIVDIGEDDTRVTSFRITAAGARTLGGEPVEPVSPDGVAPNVVVQPNFQLLVFEPTGEDVLFRLDRFAERRRVDQAIEYELTRESV